MDYDEVLQHVGDLGPYQKRLLTISLIPIVYNSFGGPVNNFLMGNHLHRCKIPWLPNDTYNIQDERHAALINESIPMEEGTYAPCHILINGTKEACSDWVFDNSIFTRTINSQYLAVCDMRMMVSHATMTYYFGYMVSSLLMCPLADLFGRRLVACISLTLQFIANILMPFSVNIYMFAVLRFFDGFFGLSFYATAFVIVLELVGPSKRQVTGTLILLAYCIGEYILVFLAFFIRDWRLLQLALAVPMAVAVLYWWPRILPESPRWLLSRERTEEALKIIKRAAMVNHSNIERDITIIKLKEADDEGILLILKKLFTSNTLVIRWIIVAVNWFVISFIYHGIQLNIGHLGENLYLTFFFNVIVETIGYFLVFFINKTGRRRMHLVTMFAMAAVFVASVFTVMFLHTNLNWVTVTLAMIGKLLISLSFGVIYIYTGELFPTVVRSVVIGISSFGARLGSLLTPYLYQLADGKLQSGLPLILYAGTIIVAAGLSCALPETANKKLLEKMTDTKKLKDGKVKRNSEDSEEEEKNQHYDHYMNVYRYIFSSDIDIVKRSCWNKTYNLP